MHRLAILDHDVVRDVDDVVDRADACRAKTLPHPLGTGRNFDVFHHAGRVPQAKIVCRDLDIEKVSQAAFRAALHNGLMMAHGNVERRRRLAREAEKGIAVRAVVRDLEFYDGVVVADDFVHVLADLYALVIEDPDAVFIGRRAVVDGEAELFERAQHAVRLHAAELSLRDVDAAGKIGIVLGNGDKVAFRYILRAGDDLKGLALADVYHADPHVVGVFVLGHGQNLADDDIFDVLVHACGRLDLLTGDGHDLVVFLIGCGDIDKLFEPFSRNIHCFILLLRTATGSGCRFQKSCACR